MHLIGIDTFCSSTGPYQTCLITKLIHKTPAGLRFSSTGSFIMVTPKFHIFNPANISKRI